MYMYMYIRVCVCVCVCVLDIGGCLHYNLVAYCIDKKGLMVFYKRPSFSLSLSLCVYLSRYGYMIDNIILLITGTLHQRQISEMRAKCHPLGSFAEMESINIASTPAELYSAVLVDTPLG